MQSTLQQTARRADAAWVTAVACAGQFLVVLDVSIVNVALPSIQADLGAAPDQLHWVVNAYALAFAGFLLLGGRAADRYGRRRMFVTGLALFSLASVVGGTAVNPDVLIAARAVQGLGAAVLAPATLTILTTGIAEGPLRVRALAAWSAIGAVGGATGSMAGGLLTEAFSWRWVLLINVPLGVAMVAAAMRRLPEGREPGVAPLDVAGAVTVTAGLCSLAYGISQTGLRGWTSAAALLPLLLGLAALAGFVVHQARTSRAPLMPLRIFRSRAVSAANVVMVLSGAAGFAMWYFLSLYMQNVLGYGAARAGLAFLPHTLALVLAARCAPALLVRFGLRRLAVLGALITAAGFGWQSRITTDSGLLDGILGPGALICLGMGLAFTPLAGAATSGVARSEAGLASGILTTARQIGGALGLASLAAVAAAHSAGSAGTAAQALGAGYSAAFVGCALLMLAAAAVSLVLPART